MIDKWVFYICMYWYIEIWISILYEGNDVFFFDFYLYVGVKWIKYICIWVYYGISFDEFRVNVNDVCNKIRFK